MKYRGEADYNPSYIFTKEDYINFEQEAVKLYDQIKEFLKKEDFI